MFNDRTAFHNSLSMRWFTPRGQAIREQLLAEMAHADRARLQQLLEPVRRPGVWDDALDLRGIDLERECLAGLDLAGADLAGAILVDADLQHAALRGANLVGARLSGANLRRADLSRADLSRADLRRANLTEADLQHAILREARLAEAQLRRASIQGIDLTAVDLSQVDLSSAIRQRKPALPPRPTRRHQRVGRPPATEPRRPPTRKVTRPVARPHGEPDPKIIRFEPRTVTGSFDDALAELLSSRHRVERIVAVIDGEERVLLDAPRTRRQQPI